MVAGSERRHNDLATEAGIHGIKMEFVGLNLEVPEETEFDEDRATRMAEAAIARKKAEWEGQR